VGHVLIPALAFVPAAFGKHLAFGWHAIGAEAIVEPHALEDLWKVSWCWFVLGVKKKEQQLTGSPPSALVLA